MKKLLLTLGTIAAVATPVSSVVACSNGGSSNSHNTLGNGIDLSLANPFKNVTHDGFFVWDKEYSGHLWNDKTFGQGAPETGIQELKHPQTYRQHVLEMGKEDPTDVTEKEDSIYVAYDSDDSDGFSINNFTDTVFFEDTSVARDEKIWDFNKNIFGNPTLKNSQLIGFSAGATKSKGAINTYVGSQNNHVSVGHAYSTDEDFKINVNKLLNQFKTSHPEIGERILKYYGYKQNEKGELIKDPTIQGASTGFAPVFYTQPIFTYEKIFDNVIKITYHDRKDFQCTAAHMGFMQKDGSFDSRGELSLGKDDWAAYKNDLTNTFVGYKGAKPSNVLSGTGKYDFAKPTAPKPGETIVGKTFHTALSQRQLDALNPSYSMIWAAPSNAKQFEIEDDDMKHHIFNFIPSKQMIMYRYTDEDGKKIFVYDSLIPRVALTSEQYREKLVIKKDSPTYSEIEKLTNGKRAGFGSVFTPLEDVLKYMQGIKLDQSQKDYKYDSVFDHDKLMEGVTEMEYWSNWLKKSFTGYTPSMISFSYGIDGGFTVSIPYIKREEISRLLENLNDQIQKIVFSGCGTANEPDAQHKWGTVDVKEYFGLVDGQKAWDILIKALQEQL